MAWVICLKRKRQMKIQTKITLLFFSITTCGLILLNASIFYFVSAFNFEDFFKRLEARVNLSAQISLRTDEKAIAYKEVRSRYLEKLENERDYIIQLKQGTPIFKKPINVPDDFYNSILNGNKARYNIKNRFYAGSLFTLPQGRYIVIASATDPHGFKEIEDLKKILIINFIISIVLTFIVGHLFSRYTIKPVSAIIKRVKNITANNLHLRLPEIKGSDEIAELTYTFNNMLNRLETAFETQNNFVSNASHELRTPLAIITSETELLISSLKTDDKSVASAKTILTEAEKLEHILASLLGLAQSGFDGKKQNWQRIRIDELVLNVSDAIRKIDSESIVNIDFSSLPEDEQQLYTDGNINLLQLAVSNIVINACKYSNNKPVEIKVSSANERIMIKVSDQGIGIPLKEQQFIFEPFFRASNTTDFEGHGIGLPLTLNIIRLHKGSIGIRSEEKIGTEIQILLPIAK